MWDFLIYIVPWWVWLIFGLIALAALHRLIGWRGITAIVPAILAILFVHRARQQGWQDRGESNEEQANDLQDRANQIRKDYMLDSADHPDERVRDNTDGYRRD